MEINQTFSSLGIDEDILSAIEDLGYTEPTPIQAQSIEKLMKGFDLIGQSQTGTGKTAAFGIPLIELIDPEDRRMQAAVLCPTRELCMQVTEELRKLLKYKPGIRVVAVYGGQPINRQIVDMKKGTHIVVGTPGRFLDHLRRHTLRLDQVQMVVLDEADEMLNMGFRDDIDLILSQMPTPRQTVLFSATMPDPIRQLATSYMEDPIEIRTTPEDQLTVDKIEQVYFELKAKMKPDALRRLLDLHRPERCLIFCNTKKQVAALTEYLQKFDYPADGLHGDLKQGQRDLVMRRFRQGDVSILIATDVAARGLDISGIDIVFNFDIPEEQEAYVHRIGRTGRAGKSGKSFTFVVGKELTRLQEIMQYTGTSIEPQRLPTLQEVEESQRQQLMEDIKANITGDKAAKYLGAVRHLESEGFDAAEIAAALFAQILYTPSDRYGDDMSKAPTRVSADGYQNSPMVRLHFNVGKKHKVRIKDLVGSIAGECGIPGSSLGHIDVLETFSYVELPSALAGDVIAIMNGNEIKGKKIKVELADAGK